MSSRTEYASAILPALPPPKAAEVIRDRLNNAKMLNDELADWLQERARIEEHYAAELDKLARRGPLAHEAALGTLSSVWSELTRSTRATAKSSADFARKTRSEIETPIRNFSSKSPQWADVRSLHDGLSNLAKNLSTSEDSFEKLRANAKKRTSSKTDAAQVAVAENRSQWENQAPYALGQFETVDESRLVLLKDTLTRLQTLEADRGQAIIASSESALNALLSFEPIEEIRSFAAQIVAGNFEFNGSSSSTAAPAGHSFGRSRTDSSRASVGSDDLYSSRDRAPSNRHPSVADDSSSTYSGNAPLGGSGGASKLRSRVGSIFRSNKNKNKPETGPKPGRGSNLATSHSPAPSRQPTIPESPTSSHEPSFPQSARAPPAVPGNAFKPAPPPSRKANGQAAPAPSPLSGSDQPARYRNTRTPPVLNEVNEDEDDVPLYGISTGQQPALRVNIRQDSITEEQEDADVALSNVTSTLRSRPTISGRGSRGRRDIQSRLFTGIEASEMDLGDSSTDQSPAQESNPAALGTQFFSQLQTFPPPRSVDSPATSEPLQPQSQPLQPLPAQSQPVQSQSVQRELEQPGPMAAPIALSEPPISQPVAQPIPQPMPVPVATSMSPPVLPVSSDYPPPAAPFRTQQTGSELSVQSGQSVQSVQSAVVPTLNHPDLPHGNGGISATISELVNATFKDGTLVQSSLGGEITIGSPHTQLSSGFVYLKVNGADKVDKLIPNPGLVQPSSVQGTYKIDTSNPHLSSSVFGVSQGTVAFKYSVAANTSSVPLVFVPIWRIEESQSSLMLTYKLADDYPTDSLAVNQLTVSVPVEGGVAVSAQSLPAGLFNKDRQQVVWKFTEPVTFSKGSESRLLCRFVTEGRVHESSAGVEVHFQTAVPVSHVNLEYAFKAQEDPFGDDPQNSSVSLPAPVASWEPVEMAHGLSSGKYVAHSEQNVQNR